MDEAVYSVLSVKDLFSMIKPSTVKKVLADFVVLYVTDEVMTLYIAELYVTQSLVKLREMVENLVTYSHLLNFLTVIYGSLCGLDLLCGRHDHHDAVEEDGDDDDE